MLKRKVYDTLLEWKNRKHKCLFIKGQHRVGKTSIIEKFGHENYEHFVSFNFSEEADIHSIFRGNLDADFVIRGMMLYRNPDDFHPGSTLILLDEIQECPEARTALKFLTIDGRYDVIASGSLPGVDIPRKKFKENGAIRPLVPTGYEEHIEMHSLDFEEFLWANNISEDIIERVKTSIREKRVIDKAVYERFESLFRDYMVVGGMPESVEAYILSKNYAAPDKVLKDIVDCISLDINRYNSGVDCDRTLECFRSIPSQLADTNKKFMYSRISGGKSRKSSDTYSENLLWIKGAGIGNFCYSLNTVESPLVLKENHDIFKVYLSDTGILTHMCGNVTVRAVVNGDTSVNQGSIVENAVCECLVKSGYVPRYYRKNSGEMMMELDFVVEIGSELAVIEVKSGKQRTAPSLNKVPRFFRVDRRIVLEQSNVFVSDDGVEHYPLFASAFLAERT